MRRAKLLAVVVLAWATLGFACGPAHERAEEVVAGSYGVLTTLQDKYEATCKQDATQMPCVRINKAIAAHNLAIEALNLYCAGPGWAEGGECTPTKEHEPRMREAVQRLDEILKELRRLL